MVLAVLVGCSPTQAATVREVPLPTTAAFPTESIDMSDPARAALAFLGAWEAQNFPLMYQSLTFSAQETISYDDFLARYEDAQNTMTFESLSFQERTMSAISSQTAQLSYDVTFQTRILGEITDNGRTLTVIRDNQTGLWGVAWTVGDIFAEFAQGARLEFQSNAPSRANIYARDGEIIADMQGRMVEVYVVRDELDDWETCRATVADITGQTPERIDGIFAQAQPSWSMRVGLLEPDVYQAEQLRLETDCEATFDSIPTRRYHPNGSVMPHVLGYIGLPNPDQVDELVRDGFTSETLIGQAGIEQSWNDTLMGTPGGSLELINADGTLARELASVTSGVAESIWLTIDLDFQQYVIDTFNTFYANNGARADGGAGWGRTSPGAAAVVMNVNTGEILALVSYPTYDANAFTPYPAIGREAADDIQADIAADERNPLLNRATQGQYPAGSIFKVIDSAAVLDTGIYDPNTTYFCAGFWEYEGDVRSDWWPPGHSTVNVQTALMQSCNPFYYETGFVLNNADPFFLPNYARRMGLGDFTGLTDIPEEPGLVPDPDTVRELYGLQWTYSNAVNLAIGQGEVAVTPLQMARLYAGIANDGNLMRPYLVQETGILNQRTQVAQPEVMSTFDFGPNTLPTIRAGLCDVITENYGTASHIFNLYPPSPLLSEGIGVCGKTGTAQAPDDSLPFSWFASYAPADEPEIAVIVLVEAAGDGSAVAAPITRQILEYYFFLND